MCHVICINLYEIQKKRKKLFITLPVGHQTYIGWIWIATLPLCSTLFFFGLFQSDNVLMEIHKKSYFMLMEYSIWKTNPSRFREIIHGIDKNLLSSYILVEKSFFIPYNKCISEVNRYCGNVFMLILIVTTKYVRK